MSFFYTNLNGNYLKFNFNKVIPIFRSRYQEKIENSD